MIDVFDETRRLVSAREVAELNGLHPNRSGFVCCPLHHEKTASLKLFPNGTWHCFGCGKGGSSIDLEMRLHDVEPLEAVRRLNEAFRLGLPLDRPPDKAERAAAKRRQEINDISRLFEEWRDRMIRQLNNCFYTAHMALKSIETPADLDRLTNAQALAIREQARVEYYADLLSTGTMEDMMAIFRERGRIGQLCNRILSNTQTKSSVA